jgi:hypothetical protein
MVHSTHANDSLVTSTFLARFQVDIVLVTRVIVGGVVLAIIFEIK